MLENNYRECEAHNFDSNEYDDGHEEEENGSVDSDIVEESVRVTSHLAKQRNLRYHVCLGERRGGGGGRNIRGGTCDSKWTCKQDRQEGGGKVSCIRQVMILTKENCHRKEGERKGKGGERKKMEGKTGVSENG